jgi:hypothetical protein
VRPLPISGADGLRAHEPFFTGVINGAADPNPPEWRISLVQVAAGKCVVTRLSRLRRAYALCSAAGPV